MLPSKDQIIDSLEVGLEWAVANPWKVSTGLLSFILIIVIL